MAKKHITNTAQAERLIAHSWDWTDEDWALQWAIDLWYEAMAVLAASRAPA